jgi:hypothetical protein
MAKGNNALRFAEGDVVPPKRFYAQPTQNAMGNEVPDQSSQALAAAALQNQQLANQQTQFVPPSGMTPNTSQYASPTGIASGYAADYSKETPETAQTRLASLRPMTQELPGGYSGYGQDAYVASRPLIYPASMGGGTAARELPGGYSGYGQDAYVASRPLIYPASMGGGTAAPTIDPATLAVIKDFFSTEAAQDPAKVVEAALGSNLNAEQMASAWASLTGGSYTEKLAAIQSYMDTNPNAKIGGGSGGQYKKGGLLSLAAGGMAKGAFVLPADVVSMAGGGSTEAGLRSLTSLLGNVQPIKGGGTGLSDSIATNIDGRQPARVADGEAYLDPATVAKIGGGDHNNGAKKLYAMMNNIRQQAHGKTSQQREVNPAKALKG